MPETSFKQNNQPYVPKPQSIKEQRVRKITQLYYSKPWVQKAIFEFCKHREICPRYFEGFGKRPDTFQFQGDMFELVKKGATSFHCSEEIWENPLEISTELNEKQFNEIRDGWDFLLDIDSKYIDYSKIMVQEILKLLTFHGVKNVGLKFSGSKGFHMIIPWKAFPETINEVKTSDMFPEWPRIVLQYINEKINKSLVQQITRLTIQNKYVRDVQASEEVIPDLVLVSPRHLFRAPYSLHEKTSLASIVLTKEQVANFEMKDADPMKVSEENVRDFMPDTQAGEASELLMQALDWYRETQVGKEEEEEKVKGKYANFKPIELKGVTDQQFPPCVLTILKGMQDGRKRGLFVLINLFRSIGMDKEELEKRIETWNEKNEVPIKKGYIKSQLEWSYRRKPILPQNCQEFYKGIGVCKPDNLCSRIKNPVNYVTRKNWSINNKDKYKKKNFNKQKPKKKKVKNKENKPAEKKQANNK
jgi:hypothetical protein